MADELTDLLKQHRHLNAHEVGRLPCLCKRCLVIGEETTDVDGVTYHRSHAIANGRILLFWVPEDLLDQLSSIQRSVAADMRTRIQ